MLKLKVTILFVGLTCFSFISGFSTVICHGADGHIALELPVHNHCKCPETDQNDKQNKFAGTTIRSSTEHEHCKDTIVTPNILLPMRKNVKSSTHKFFAANLSLKPIPTHTRLLLRHLAVWGSELSSFHTPLRSIILLA